MEPEASSLQLCEKAQEKVAYEYLCHLQEAKIWMELVLKENLPPITKLEENLQNGVYLARIGNAIAPEVVPLSRIYDIFQHRFRLCGLEFKHIDNINYWIKALEAVKLPSVFHPEPMDVYNKKNMPKVIYCIHALSMYLFKMGKTPIPQTLYGKVDFSQEAINSTCLELKDCKFQIPSFRKINRKLSNDDSTCNQDLLHNINNAICSNSQEKLLSALSNPAAGLVRVMPENIAEYMSILRSAKDGKELVERRRSSREGHEPDTDDQLLTQSEVQGYVRSVNCDCLWRNIEESVKAKNEERLRECLSKISSLDIEDFNPDNLEYYKKALEKLGSGLNSKKKVASSREIFQCLIRTGNQLVRERVRVSEVTDSIQRKSLDAFSRALRAPSLRLTPFIVDAMMPAYFDKLCTRLKTTGDLTYRDVREVVEVARENAIKDVEVGTPIENGNHEQRRSEPQSETMGRKRKMESSSEETVSSSDGDMQNVDKVIKIQRFWRRYKERKTASTSKFPSLRKMVLEQGVNNHNYDQQLRIQGMRSSVVETIKENQELATRLDEMDTKIGLLVQNRMRMQDLQDWDEKNGDWVASPKKKKGIKAFNRVTKSLLDGYGQLFYMLQTDPAYLTNLLVRLPEKSTRIVQSCILSLFNYGSSPRDMYLVLRLFHVALIEEIREKYEKPADVVRRTPVVLRIALAFVRQCLGYNPLRNILGSLIQDVLTKKTFMDTNPVDIYRRWVNRIETETGEASRMGAVVTVEEALSHAEVSVELKRNLKDLKIWVKAFLKRISACVDKFPYALRFVAKTLWEALKKRFPELSDKNIVKIVGNLVFYHYISSAIVAPDAYYVVSFPVGEHLKPEQRRNLASIAKMIQYAGSGEQFKEGSHHLESMNSFLKSCGEEMKLFCKRCCSVENLEKRFGMTKYSEAVLIEKPKIYMRLGEICDCHRILHDERRLVSTDPFDPIHDVLDSLGSPPSAADLLGLSPSEASTSRARETQVSLELENRLELPAQDPNDAEKLFIKTKEAILKRMENLQGRTLTEAVENGRHEDIAANLMNLELEGLTKRADDYDSIVSSLLRDLARTGSQELDKEIATLTSAQERLDEKRKYYEDQISYYETYLRTCLDALTKSSKSELSSCQGEKRKIRAVKYTANRLLEKRVVISLEGVPSDQMKNVRFEISNTEIVGLYSVRGLFMGTEVDKITIDVQDLLQRQFEGQAVMDLFGKAKVNVNLLLHLLNKKFHAR